VQEKAKSRRARLLSGPLVDIYVGESKRHWALHRNLLCHHSEHLASILFPSDETKKKAENKLDLLDDDPAGFELLVKWLYQGKLDDVSNLPDPHSKYDYAVSCHKLYLLCERFEMPQLKNIAMDQYRKGLSEARLVPDAAEMNEIYRNSSEGSPFRRLMTKIAARQIMDPDSEKDAESYRECFDGHPDFAIDLVNAIKMGIGGLLFDDPTYGDGCEYHDHDAGPNCHIRGKGRAKQGK
jgi:BTB/POZ domain